ncbi:Hypothetical protein CINCED_3A001726 [Cinara cedri]|uniref:Uncharacterized protein n=1 Tax=Cinara cedri TaxID=506608 RepID=A0A5E4N0Q3_9HEMI|nr:Hypothetical protein CINCED_3A001726 [Cinara cedri]
MDINKSFENSPLNSNVLCSSKHEGEEIIIYIKKEVDIIDGFVYESEVVIETDLKKSILY